MAVVLIAFGQIKTETYSRWWLNVKDHSKIKFDYFCMCRLKRSLHICSCMVKQCYSLGQSLLTMSFFVNLLIRVNLLEIIKIIQLYTNWCLLPPLCLTYFVFWCGHGMCRFEFLPEVTNQEQCHRQTILLSLTSWWVFWLVLSTVELVTMMY